MKTIAPTVAGVHLGLDCASAGEIEVGASSTQYIDFTVTNSDYSGRIMDINSDASLNWFDGANATATPNMTQTPSGLFESGAAVSIDKRLKCDEKP